MSIDDQLSDSSDSDSDAFPAITHSVAFKCMGSVKELRYQEILSSVANKMKLGETVPAKIEKEASNPVDSRATAFMCKLHDHDEWERIEVCMLHHSCWLNT